MATHLPNWATPKRVDALVKVGLETANLCPKGEPLAFCTDPRHQFEQVPVKRAYVQYVHETVTMEKVRYAAVSPVRGMTRPKHVPTLFDKKFEELRDGWIADDRDQRRYEERLEMAVLRHESGRFGGTVHPIFAGRADAQTGIARVTHVLRRSDPVERERYVYQQQPAYHLVAMGVNPFTMKPVALVRVPSTTVTLTVDISKAWATLSRNARKKSARYGKHPPASVMAMVGRLARQSVQAFWLAHPK